MSAEEIRKIADNILLLTGVEQYPGIQRDLFSRTGHALLAYAATVERCEEYRKVMQETGDNMYSKLIEEIIYNIQHGTKGATDERK